LQFPSSISPTSIYIRLAYCAFSLEDPEGVIENAKKYLNHPSICFISKEDITDFAYILGVSKAASDENLRYFFEYFLDHPKFLPFFASQ